MKQYTTLLLDADDTLFDFDECEKGAFFETFSALSYSLTWEEFLIYKQINKKCWDALDAGEITREELVKIRFEKFFKEISLSLCPIKVNDLYLETLGDWAVLFDRAKEFLQTLKPERKIYIVSNAISQKQQNKRLAKSGIWKYIDGTAISQEVGIGKPSREFFDYAFSKFSLENKEGTLLIGDSLSADIMGANQYGIDCIWFNNKNKELNSAAKPTYIATSYDEILSMLKKSGMTIGV